MSLLLSYTAIILLVAQTSQAYTSRGHCQPVPSFCRNLTNGDSYTKMRLPNAFNNYHLNETISAIRPWEPLVGQGCHAGLKLFLCAIYAPICLQDKESGLQVTIKLCKSFCSSVKASCVPVMESYNHSWPPHEAFNCSHYVDDSMCVREDFVAATAEPPTTSANDVICDPSLNPDDVLLQKACSSTLVVRAEVTGIRDAKGDSSYTLLKIKRHKKVGKSGSVRKSRKTNKASDNPDRVLVPQTGCRNLSKRVKKDNSYLIILDKRSGKKTKYIVKAIVPWKTKRPLYKRMLKRSNLKRSNCRGR